jgi:hypothetical protein
MEFTNIGTTSYGDRNYATFVIHNWDNFKLEVLPNGEFYLNSDEQRNADRVKAQIQGLKRDDAGNLVKQVT